MKSLFKALILLLGAGFFIFNPGSVSAACQVQDCAPIFASDQNLNNPVNSLQQSSLTSFSPANLYVGYQVTCDAGDRVTIPYCSDAWYTGVGGRFNYCQGSKVDAQDGTFIQKNGQNYFVARIPGSDYNRFAGHYNDAPDKLHRIQTNLWSGNFLCSQDATIQASYLTETCSSLNTNPVRRTNGTYAIPVTIGTQDLIPGKNYNLILAYPNTLDIINTRSATFTTPADHSPVQRGFDDVNVPAGTYTVCVVAQDANEIVACASAHSSCKVDIQLDGTLPIDEPDFPDETLGSEPYYLCNQIPSTTENYDVVRQGCLTCAEQNGVWTAIGCIQTDAQSIISSLMRLGLGIAGGVALIMILAAGFLFSTSQGDVKRTGEAKDMMSSAVIGLLFIIFSVTILQFVGVSILQIPGFGQ